MFSFPGTLASAISCVFRSDLKTNRSQKPQPNASLSLFKWNYFWKYIIWRPNWLGSWKKEQWRKKLFLAVDNIKSVSLQGQVSPAGGRDSCLIQFPWPHGNPLTRCWPFPLHTCTFPWQYPCSLALCLFPCGCFKTFTHVYPWNCGGFLHEGVNPRINCDVEGSIIECIARIKLFL